jgi:hypothetical protein
MEVEERGRLALSYSRPLQAWVVQHSITREVAEVPIELQGSPALRFDAEGHGFIQCRDAEDKSAWVADLLKTAAIVDGSEYYISTGDEVVPWAEAFASHSVATLALEDMGRELMLMLFTFALAQVDRWRCWWSLPVLVSALDLDRRRCRSDFIHRYFQAWAAWLDKLGLGGGGHLRRATPTEQAEQEGIKDASEEPARTWRTLPHQAASSPALLALCVKLATPMMKHRSGLETGRWTMLLVALLALCMAGSHGHGYQLHVPTDPWSVVAPNTCEVLQVAADGTVDLDVLRRSVWHAELKDPAADMLSQLPACCALADLLKSAYRARGMRAWWVQLVLAVAEVLEEAALATASAAAGQPGSDAAAVTCASATEVAAAATSARDRRRGKLRASIAAMLDDSLQAKVLKYYWSSRQALRGQRDMHLAVDASRIGNRSVLITTFGTGSGIVTWGPPQAFSIQQEPPHHQEQGTCQAFNLASLWWSMFASFQQQSRLI